MSTTPATHPPIAYPHPINPILPGYFADPELHFFDHAFWIFPTGSSEPFETHRFEAFRSTDLQTWTNTGVALDLKNVPWSTNRCAWAPAMCQRWNKYFMYFSAGDGAGIGVATASRPAGQYHDALGTPLIRAWPFGAQPIDANAFLDDDGQAYLYFGGHGQCVVVPLNPDMVSLAGPYQLITPNGYVEGPFMFKRHGVYYFLWSEGNWQDETYGVAYAMANSPRGPFHRIDKILDSSCGSCAKGPGHNSVLRMPNSQDDWRICYHRRPLNATEGGHRVTCIDRLHFFPDGKIARVQMT